MKKLLLIIVVLSAIPAAASTSYWIGIDKGIGTLENKDREKTVPGGFVGSKVFASFENSKLFFDVGAGIAQLNLETSYDLGPYGEAEYNSRYGFLYLSPKIKLNKQISVGLENQVILTGPIKTGLNDSQSGFSGLSLNYHTAVSDSVLARVGASFQNGWNLDRSTQIAMISLQLGYSAPKKETPPTKKVLPVEVRKELELIIDKFEFASPNLPSGSEVDLDNVVTQIKDKKILSIRIEGHTDIRGPTKLNQALSKKRADKAAEYLISKGIPEDKIISSGKADSERRADGLSSLVHDLNRRVTLKVIYIE